MLDRHWKRVFHRRDDARAAVLRYPTLDRGAILAKLAIAEEARDEEETTPCIANSLLAALGIEGRP